MQRINILCIGKLKTKWAKSACDDYEERLQRTIKLTVTELPASKESDSDRQRDDESKRILLAAEKIDGERYILDERGNAFTSPAFAKLLSGAADRGQTIVLLLGGAYGFTDTVRKSAKTLRLSDMTLPHELCRVLLFEQLYRATEITRGSGYHH